MALYDRIGAVYADHRRSDPRIAAAIETALGEAQSVVNIGAGTGSYEPAGRDVIAVEPSQVMIAQRPPGAAPCLQGTAEALPLEDKSVDAAMAVLTLHHWTNPARGLEEMARVARRCAVLLTWVPEGEPFWLTRDYFPEIAADDAQTFPATPALAALMELTMGSARIEPVLIPHDCTDGFLCAFWRRPQAYLDAAVRGGMSSFARFDATAGLARLAADLDSGRWAQRNGDLLSLDAMDLGYRLVRCDIV